MAATAATRITKPIDQVEVGQRVAVDAPMADQDLAFGTTVDPATWRRVTLQAPNRDFGSADVTMLRPAAWLAERGATVGGSIEINVPECGIEGQAEVLALGPCPAIEPGEGRIVTGTFRHSAANIIDLHVEGLSEPIGTTANHPFWSVDRQSFVRADTLQPRERLRALDGPLTVARIVTRSEPAAVYNLEVQVDHVYHVGNAGLLVHNGTDDCPTHFRGAPTNLGPVGSKAPRQVTPGIRELDGHYVDDLGRSQPWRAHYDEHGRMIGRTDYNAGNRAAGIPDTHHERWEYDDKFPLGRKVENHVPGEFPQ